MSNQKKEEGDKLYICWGEGVCVIKVEGGKEKKGQKKTSTEREERKRKRGTRRLKIEKGFSAGSRGGRLLMFVCCVACDSCSVKDMWWVRARTKKEEMVSITHI